MGFNLGRAVTDVATGGLSEVYNALKPGQQTVNQQVMETPEQKAARLRLDQFSRTGTYDFGGGKTFSAGDAYTGELGDFSLSPQEQQANTRLSGLISGGRSDLYNAGQKTIQDLLTTDRFDPYSANGEFTPFKDAVNLETQQAQGRAKNAAAFSGNLYSKNTNSNLADIESSANLQLQSKLAQLFSDYTGRKIQGANTALDYEQAGQNMDLNAIGAGFQYGGLQRNLNTANDQARLSEFLRQRQELMTPINTATTLAGTNPNYSVPSVTTQTPSPWLDLLKTGISAGGMILGARGSG